MKQDPIPNNKDKAYRGRRQRGVEELNSVTTEKTHCPKRIRLSGGHAIAGKAETAEMPPDRRRRATGSLHVLS